MMTECHVESWVGSWDRKKVLGKNQGNLSKAWTLIFKKSLSMSSPDAFACVIDLSV